MQNPLKLFLTHMMQYRHNEYLSAFYDRLDLYWKCNLKKLTVHVSEAFPKEVHVCVSECAYLNVCTYVWIAVLMDVPVHLVWRQWAQLLSMPAGH